ncbi:MAG TPA: DNA primase [Candidatus Paceibacterota bacterium]|nr:DNA primase [Candidatus Paceibacterota bacterium]
MANTPVDIIKEKLDIVDFLKGYIQLIPAGRNFKGLCPFHREKTPSFMVSPERQGWHCFGCNIGGDIFGFVMRYENVEFGEALKILADKAGVELKRVSPAEYRHLGLLYDINEKAKDFFKRELETSQIAKEYISKRGLSNETVEEFELGFAPAGSEALVLHLINSGFHPDDILRAGLSFKTDRGLQFDRFRGRIMFPIHNHLGKTVGFTGRILPQFDDGKSGKYVNSPETPIFAKSKLLYGFWKSKNFIRDTKQAFLVEGQMDFLMSWQAGVKNVVASSGTALTGDHLVAIRRLADQLVISFDNDEAGRDAGERAIDLAEAADFGIKVAIFNNYKDPAEAALADKKYFFEVIENAKPAAEFYFEKYLPAQAGLPGNNFDVRDRDSFKNLRIVLEKIKNISSPVLKSFWLKELSKRTGVNELTLSEEMERAAPKKVSQSEESSEQVAEAKKFSRWEMLAQRCLAWLLQKGDFSEGEKFFPHLPGNYREIFSILKSGKRRSDDPLTDELLNLIIFQQREAGTEEFETLKLELYKEYLKERRRELISLIGSAERSGDQKSLEKAMHELDDLPTL